ncbi:MAG: bifunctional phosphoribosyl-AMP cyclohydrolase/phosphoribosyl-ATP diphosphatase HisIE [Maricaulaceae bacterium]
MTIDFEKGGGLVPAIIQNSKTEKILMLGYMNAESFAQTLETGKVTFYSRSRKELWVKGGTSGNYLNYISHSIDCDKDTVLVQANPIGPTCHEGTESCFQDHQSTGVGFLSYLESLIEARKTADPESSYTAQLLQGPLQRAAQKVGEEGVETALAAVAETDDKLTSEAADLLYHLLVLLRAKGVGLDNVVATLRERHK